MYCAVDVHTDAQNVSSSDFSAIKFFIFFSPAYAVQGGQFITGLSVIDLCCMFMVGLESNVPSLQTNLCICSTSKEPVNRSQ